MAWVRIDDHYDEHAKHASVGPLGTALWLAGLAYANRNLSDGFIPWAKARSLVTWTFLAPPGDDGRERVQTISVTSGMTGLDVDSDFVIDLLVHAGLWHEVPGGYQIHDYLHYQTPAEQIRRGREQNATRQDRWRKRNAVTNSVTNGEDNASVTHAPNPNPNPSEAEELSSGLPFSEGNPYRELSDSAENGRVEPATRKQLKEAFEAWKRTLPAEARDRVKLTKQRAQKYSARRRDGYAQETILAALTNYVHDPWEERTTDAKARDFATLLRDGGQVERFSQMRPGDRRANSRPIDRGYEVPIWQQCQDLEREIYAAAQAQSLEDEELEQLVNELRAAGRTDTPLESLAKVRQTHGL